jgi:hypothetical protein
MLLPETAYKPMVIEKSESVMLRLKEIADIGFHQHGNNSVLFPKILRIRELKKLKRISR